MIQKLAGKITRYTRPYVLDASELLKKAHMDTNKVKPVDVGKLITISKLENSFASEANMKYWQHFIDKYELPKYGALDVMKNDAIKRYIIVMSIGVFHYEFLIDDAEYTDDMIYNASFEYACDLLCPRKIMIELMKKMTPLKDIAQILCVPEVCVATVIKKILQEGNF